MQGSSRTAYLKKFSLRRLNVEGGSSDQQPGDGFSPFWHGTVSPALGRNKYLCERPYIQIQY